MCHNIHSEVKEMKCNQLLRCKCHSHNKMAFIVIISRLQIWNLPMLHLIASCYFRWSDLSSDTDDSD